MRQVARNVHEVEVGFADELDFGRVEQAEVIFADEPRILDCFLRQVSHVSLGADDAYVVRITVLPLFR